MTPLPAPRYPLYIANRPESPNADLEVRDKFSGEVVAEVAMAGPAEMERALAAAWAAREAMRRLPAFARRDALAHCARRFTERAAELARLLCAEAGKPIRDARGEVTRLIDTFRVAAEEATRITGETLPLDITERARDYEGMWKRVPVGVCSFITPFNFPLNLAAHKVAPALAAGCPFLLRPSRLTPLGALVIGEVLAETALPPGAFSVLPCDTEVARPMITDERVRLLSFTGSQDTGWRLKAEAGRKRVCLELGGNAACVVDADTDLDDATRRLVFGAFYQSGQSCISVQRIFAHEAIYEALREKLTAAARALRPGDPRDEATFLGPMISEGEARRVEEWVRSAMARGARLLCGGRREGALMEATLLENVPPDEPVSCREVFGPVAILEPFRDFGEALRRVNASDYGLQAGVFTRDLYKAMRAWDEIEAGGVVIGDVPSWRVDHMPYGGVKHSGEGREGVRFAIQEMTEIRLLVLRRLDRTGE